MLHVYSVLPLCIFPTDVSAVLQHNSRGRGQAAFTLRASIFFGRPETRKVKTYHHVSIADSFHFVDVEAFQY